MRLLVHKFPAATNTQTQAQTQDGSGEFTFDCSGDRDVVMNGQTNILPQGSRRERRPVVRYSEETYTPGSNNQYTAGREVDPYDRGY